MIGSVFGWLGRKAVLYVLLVVAIAASTFVVPWIKQVAAGTISTQKRTHVLGIAASRIASERDAAAKWFGENARVLRFESIVKLDEQGRRLNKERVELEVSINAAKPAWVLAIVDQNLLLDIERSKLRVAVIDQQLPAISAARDVVVSNGASIKAIGNLPAQTREAMRLAPPCDQAR